MSRPAIIGDLVAAGLLTQAQAINLGADGRLGSAISYADVGQGAAVADPTGGVTVDAEARTAITNLLGELRTLGVIAT